MIWYHIFVLQHGDGIEQMDGLHEDLRVEASPRVVFHRCMEDAAVLGRPFPVYNTKRVWEGGLGPRRRQGEAVETRMIPLQMIAGREGGALLVGNGLDTARYFKYRTDRLLHNASG